MRSRIGILAAGIVLGASLLASTGCVGMGLLAVQRSIVYDDVVYVRDNMTLYKRFRSDAVMAPYSLRMQHVGSITSGNENLILFPNYGAAVASGLRFRIDPESRPDIPYSTQPRSVRVKEREEYRYSERTERKIAEEIERQKELGFEGDLAPETAAQGGDCCSFLLEKNAAENGADKKDKKDKKDGAKK
jgi:hypothetical protein